MSSFFSRRRRASPRPGSGDDVPGVAGHDDVNITSPHNRRRRRQSKDMDDAAPLLPLTYHHPTTTKLRHASSPVVSRSTTTSNVSRHYGAAGGLPLMAPGSSTCNSFLMGGHYYPGKDKKRKQYFQRRRYTCWHRFFCSSTWRMVGSTIACAYLMVWHIILPATDMVLEYGRFWSGPSQQHDRNDLGWQYHRRRQRRRRRKQFEDLHGTLQWLMHDATLHLPTLQQRRDEMEKLQTEQERIQYYSTDKRFALRRSVWEEIVPDWVHRNEPKPGGGAIPDATQEVEGGEEEAKNDNSANGDAKQQQPPNNQRKEGANSEGASGKSQTATQNARQESKDESERRRIEAVEENLQSTDRLSINKQLVLPSQRQLRTLQNMDMFANRTTCPLSLSPDNISTTLVIQSSLERLWILEETCQRWKDPMVVVIWLSPAKNVNTTTWTPSFSCPQMKLIQYQPPPGEDQRSYPVNHLRNLGLEAVETSHVLVLDIDFVPSQDLHQEIQSILLERHRQQQKHGINEVVAATTNKAREAVVVPAFERLLSTPCDTVEDCKLYLQQDPSFLPHTFSDLQGCVSSSNCSVFQSQVNWEGHHSTQSKKWLAGDWYENTTDYGDTVKSIKTIHCFDSLRYEPYVVLRWCPAGTADDESRHHHAMAPFYDERFYGYGKNKIEMISHLRFMGYRFVVLPRGFVIHHPHPESLAKDRWNRRDVPDDKSQVDASDSVDLHHEMDHLYTVFLTELATKYQHQVQDMIQQCNHLGNSK